MLVYRELLGKYNNGGTEVLIYADGTKVRRTLSDAPPLQPETMDVKITNYCDMGCSWCHESSTTKGKHGDLELLTEKLDELSPYTELAIGGGDPLSHPGAVKFINDNKFINNLTINSGHIPRYREILCDLNVRGVGVSLSTTNPQKIEELLELQNNLHVVFHVIIGITSKDEILKLYDMGVEKILLLGYKTFGLGKKFIKSHDDLINDNILTLKEGFHNGEFKNVRGVISFDNLAIDQLEIEKCYPESFWKSRYMGDDFTYSMYVDAVQGKYSPTSRSSNRVSWDQMNLLEYFQNFRGTEI